jgi:O-antigen ligase
MTYLLLIFIIIYPYVLNPFTLRQSFDKVYFLVFYVLILWILTILKLIKKEIQINKPKRRLTMYLILFVGLITLSTIFSVDRFVAVFGSRTRYEGLLALLSYISLLFFTYLYVPYKKVPLFLSALSLNGIVIGLYGILQHYGIDPIAKLAGYSPTNRSFSFFGNPNFFGSYITLVLPISMALFLLTTKKINYLHYLSASILFLALMFSETRSGWLGSFIAYTLIFLIYILKRKHLWSRWLILSFTFLAIFISLNLKTEKQYTGRIEQTFEQVEGDVNRGGSSRIFIWRTSLPILAERPILGSGPDTFAHAFPNLTEEVKPYFNNIIVDKAHNEYLQMAITLGIPALIVYLLSLYEIIRFNFMRYMREQELNHLKIFSILFVIVIISYMIQAFFNISVVSVAPLYWMLLGLAYIKPRLEESIE